MNTQMTQAETKTIPLDSIHVREDHNPRKFFNDAKQQELTRSMAGAGILQPIIVRPIKEANCSTCYILNMSQLITVNGGMLRKIPDGCTSWGTLDNCDGIQAGQSQFNTCKTTNHYLWGADNKGNVYSFCQDTGAADKPCTSNNSGYQGQFP